MMAGMCFKEGDRMRIRKTDIIYESAGDLITDEEQSIELSGISDDALLWLEEGRVSTL